jgi:transcriptional regulator with XRE-family HTH domain
MPGAQGEPPAVARQRVRRALRKAREATPLSQGDVAKRLSWSLSKVQRVESGEVGVSVTDLRALLSLYHVHDPETVEQLIEDARASRRQRYVTPADHRKHLTSALRQLVQFEREAVSIRAYQPLLYPGVVQTPAVAESLLTWGAHRLNGDERRVRFDVRMARRQQVIERADGPEYLLILDESVIKRRISDTRVTAEQLQFVADIAQRPNVRIRIVPLAKSAYMPSLGPFQILRMTSDDGGAILYREGYLHDELSHEENDVNFYSNAFEDLWKEALSEEATHRAIVAEAALRRSAIDFGSLG